MLSPKTQLNLRNAKAYFREHLCLGEYYSEGQQVRGKWYGEAAEKLGLSGIVEERAFLRLCEGLHPATGEKLTLRRNTQRRENGQSVANRRVFYDFVISPPKSVSVVGLLQDVRISALHDRAVQMALGELERAAETRVRKRGAQGARTTGNIVAAVFRHDTSRELDPHLHSHCVVLNATFDPVEQCWKALEAGGAFRVQKLVEQVYYHELCRGLRQLGYAVESTARDFEIKGVPPETIARFSKRHQQIDAETVRQTARGARRGNVKDLREEIARTTRKRKAEATSARALARTWQAEMGASERSALRHLIGPRADAPEPGPDAGALIAWADEHLFERRAVIAESELLVAALTRGRGEPVTLAELRAAVAARDYLRDEHSSQLTSREVLRCELDVVLAARAGRRAHAPLAPDFAASSRLSTEQAAAVRAILDSRDFITVFRGGAGTGKSFALAEVRRGLAAAGHSVIVTAPQRQQVESLAADGLPAQTLAHLLATQALPPGCVLLLDEAGQVGARQLRDLLELALQRRARLILSGDTRQHGAVAASDALRALEAYGDVRIAELQEIRRQDPHRGRTRDERQFIGRYRAAVESAAAGDAAGSFDRLERLGCIREVEPDQRAAALAREYLAAEARHETVLAVAQTWAEVHRANEAIRDALRGERKLGSGVMVTTLRPVDATVAERRLPEAYPLGSQVYFVRRYGRFAKGDVCEVRGAAAGGVTLAKDGRETTVGFRYADRLALVEPVRLELAPGDRLQLKLNGRSAEGISLTNGELVTVHAVRRGSVVVRDAAGRTKTLSSNQCLLHRGYAVTSYASQGKTVDTVLFADAQNTAATSRNQWYVTISRGRKRVVVFTSDRAGLRAGVARLSDRPLALELKPDAMSAASRPVSWIARARELIAHLHRRACLRRHTHHANHRRITP